LSPAFRRVKSGGDVAGLAQENVVKWLLGAVLGLIVIGGAAAVFGELGFLPSKKVDLNDPQVATDFRQKMEAACVSRANRIFTLNRETLDNEEEGKLRKVCACYISEVTRILAEKGERSPAEYQEAYYDSHPELEAAFKSCGHSIGF
jgi:hypothetical protein